MTKVLTTLVCMVCLSAIPSLARIYRWTDEAGRVHYTDNPGTIPADRRPHSRQLSPAPSRQRTPTPGAAAPRSTVPPPASSTSTDRARPEEIGSLWQRAQALKQQIDAVLQERQRYLEKLKGVREVRTNPKFGRKRRHVDDWGRSLAVVQQRLDTLQTELQEVEAQLQALAQDQQPTSSVQRPTPEVRFDTQGHDRVYWQRRLTPVRTRLQQARDQRQAILSQLAPETRRAQGTFGRRGREVLRLTRALEQVEQEVRGTEAALQALLQEATRAGAPAEWLQ